MKFPAHEKDSESKNTHNNNELILMNPCLEPLELYQFIDYLHPLK